MKDKIVEILKRRIIYYRNEFDGCIELDGFDTAAKEIHALNTPDISEDEKFHPKSKPIGKGNLCHPLTSADISEEEIEEEIASRLYLYKQQRGTQFFKPLYGGNDFPHGFITGFKAALNWALSKVRNETPPKDGVNLTTK